MEQYLREAEIRRNKKKQELVECLLEMKHLKVEVNKIIIRLDQLEKIINQKPMGYQCLCKEVQELIKVKLKLSGLLLNKSYNKDILEKEEEFLSASLLGRLGEKYIK